jgi:hypothetical protein
VQEYCNSQNWRKSDVPQDKTLEENRRTRFFFLGFASKKGIRRQESTNDEESLSDIIAVDNNECKKLLVDLRNKKFEKY